jgi:Xaa-Pro aminopeptidase
MASKLDQFRQLLVEYGLDGYFIPSDDEHLNEYAPPEKWRRHWLSEFTGSAGELLVTRDHAYLFVDSRYYEQADQQVDTSQIQVCKLELDGHKKPEEILADLADRHPQFCLGIDPFVFTLEKWRTLKNELRIKGVIIKPIGENLVDKLRQKIDPTPAPARPPLYGLPASIAGKTPTAKLQQVREKMQSAGADFLIVTKLDQIAWLFNLRGADVPCNPVFLAHAIVTHDQVYLFTDLERVTDAIKAHLPKDVILAEYRDYATKLSSICAHGKVWIDDRGITYGSYLLLESAQAILLEKDHPIETLKAQKNAEELTQMRWANLKASIAKTRTIRWLDQQAQLPISEITIAHYIENLYRHSPDFISLSFPTIAAIGTNSSIVHYGNLSAQAIGKVGDLVLLDSGCQFLGGTTDDTRTMVLGDPTPEQKFRYTEVLRAHINCAMTVFPKGTYGCQVDGITRANLWRARLDYGHGTGHGVGAGLNVHEGPNGLSKRNQQALEVGMINSIEPGYYAAGWGGIRLENLYEVQELESGWLGFRPLTYIPFVKRLIVLENLTEVERQWLETYYRSVRELLSPHLDPEEQAWLQAECSL